MMHHSIPRPHDRPKSGTNGKPFGNSKVASPKINQDQQEELDNRNKTRSLSICPSTFIASEEWKTFQKSFKKTRSKSMFIGDIGMDSPTASTEEYLNESLWVSDDEEDTGFQEESSNLHQCNNKKDYLMQRKHSGTLKVETPSSQSMKQKGKLSEFDSSCRGVADLRLSLDMSDLFYDDETVVIPMKHLMNYNRDRTGVRISRAAQYRRDHPDTPISPTDKKVGDISPKDVFNCPS
jgi:hypothetical protein